MNEYIPYFIFFIAIVAVSFYYYIKDKEYRNFNFKNILNHLKIKNILNFLAETIIGIIALTVLNLVYFYLFFSGSIPSKIFRAIWGGFWGLIMVGGIIGLIIKIYDERKK
ncbi:hypothetical protein K8R61_02430 [bacterium]|nr:hypothetical protein [bacterium]